MNEMDYIPDIIFLIYHIMLPSGTVRIPELTVKLKHLRGVSNPKSTVECICLSFS